MPKDNEPKNKPPKEPKPRRRRRGLPIGLLFILLLAAIIAALIIFKPFGGDGFGFGGGNSGGSGGSSGSEVSGSVPASDSSESNIAVIRIDGNDIFLDGEKCENAAALKDKITEIGTKKDYEIDHSAAIKATYDEVKQALSELENALDIKVNYNE